MSFSGRVGSNRCIKEASIKPTSVEHIDNKRDRIVLVIGPTGSGKSAFIEALCVHEDLGISKNQLESVTQTITPYEMVDMSLWDGPGTESISISAGFYVVDTPGFSDTQISELEIIEMINDWLKVRDCDTIDDILFMHPITDKRLSGSKRRTVDMVKLLTRLHTRIPGTVVVVTTMWDTLWNEKGVLAAEERFAQLRDDVWKDLRDFGGTVTKFFNTHESALEVINGIRPWTTAQHLSGSAHNQYKAYEMDLSGSVRNAPFTPLLYQDLLDRIQNAQQQKQSLELELTEEEVQEDPELKSILERELMKADHLLMKFEAQLIEFGAPPPSFNHVTPLRLAMMEKHRRLGATKAASNVSKVQRFLNRSKRLLKARRMSNPL
ncbi:hypothetical protein BJ165DRAFT_1405991 [Panaeolus papilionaceus]|nr:hypothetical protein BJ165DRAFT_1405991 [Panaeolus papilionaceus]